MYKFQTLREGHLMQRRLLIGAVLTVAVAGLSILPTDALRFSRPSKPLFFYLTPLVRVQFLLEDLEKAAVEGETDGESSERLLSAIILEPELAADGAFSSMM